MCQSCAHLAVVARQLQDADSVNAMLAHILKRLPYRGVPAPIVHNYHLVGEAGPLPVPPLLQVPVQ